MSLSAIRNTLSVVALAATALMWRPCPLAAQEQPQPPDEQFVEITERSRAAIDRGMDYLAKRQTESGAFGERGQNIGISSLAVLAFMADGNLPDRGPYAAQVQRGVDYIVANAQETGLVAADMSSGPMYGHGFATLLLGEVYGMTGDRRVREALIKAVRLIVNTQNQEGGWRYQPAPVDADVSVTICQIMGLRSARDAGLSVPKETIDRAVQYVRLCQNKADGGFRYQLNSGGSAFPRSAAGVASLYYAGIYQDDALKLGLDYLRRNNGEIVSRGGHYFYGHYYAVQAMYLAGGVYWAEWFPAIREELLRQQQPNGSWNSEYGEEYGTAMALLVLQIPNRFLPIFQR